MSDNIKDNSRYVVSGEHKGNIFPEKKAQLLRTIYLKKNSKVDGSIFGNKLIVESSPVFVDKAIMIENDITITNQKTTTGKIHFNSNLSSKNSINIDNKSELPVFINGDVISNSIKLNNTFVSGNIYGDNVVLNDCFIVGNIHSKRLKATNVFAMTFKVNTLDNCKNLNVFFPYASITNIIDIDNQINVLLMFPFVRFLKGELTEFKKIQLTNEDFIKLQYANLDIEDTNFILTNINRIFNLTEDKNIISENTTFFNRLSMRDIIMDNSSQNDDIINSFDLIKIMKVVKQISKYQSINIKKSIDDLLVFIDQGNQPDSNEDIIYTYDIVKGNPRGSRKQIEKQPEQIIEDIKGELIENNDTDFNSEDNEKEIENKEKEIEESVTTMTERESDLQESMNEESDLKEHVLEGLDSTLNYPMVFVQGSEFSMGGSSDENDTLPVHQVELSSFYIGKFQITQQLWKEIMDEDPSYFKGAELPVESISWLEAIRFCNELSKAYKCTECYQIKQESEINLDTITLIEKANGFRLPTEAEWEYAAKGGKYSKNLMYSGGDNIDDLVNYSENSHARTNLIGKKDSNELSIFDMSGNVFEWCWDCYDDKYYMACQENGISKNPEGPIVGSFKVVRGGSWSSSKEDCIVINREARNLDSKENDIGLRLVRNA